MARPLEINPLNYIVNRQYSDSLVIKTKLFKERLKEAKNLFRKDLLAHYGCVNAIEFSEEGDLLVSGGDDRRVLLWFVPDAIYGQGTPVVMQTNHTSNIFCLAFDKLNSKIFSGGNDDQVIVHDLKTTQLILKLPHRNPVYGLSINPQNDHMLATAGDDGRILIYDIREPVTEAICLAKQNTGFHSVVFHPTNPRLLVSANADEGIALWDCRKVKKELIHYDPMAGKVSGISACFNTSGSHVLALRRRLPPVLYATQNCNALCQFYHPQYYNSCTMKTCCFAGDEDEYVLSGSDDFNLYMWSIPEDESEWGKSHIVLHGHRSIVNQVRYNKNNNLIASSGVEKMVKLWSTLPIGSWSGSLLTDNCDAQRTVYSKDDYTSIIGPSTPRISHDYSDQSTQEDLRMMAFFDSLIQNEIQNWNSMSEDTFTSDSDSDKQVQESIRLSWQSLLKFRKSAEETLKKHKPNKIALLIAQKRNKLAKMAHWKSSAVVQRYNSREKHRKRKSIHKLKTLTTNHKFRKNNGLCTKNVHGKRVTRSWSSSSALRPSEKESTPTTSKKLHHHHQQQQQQAQSQQQQQQQQHNHTHHHHHHKSRSDTSVQKKYRTRSQSMREMIMCENSSGSANNNSSYDVPSTSTGITGTSSSVYRVIEQDSDEEAPPANVCTENNSNLEDNFVDIIPTPLNGSHDMYINMIEMPNNINNSNAITMNGNNNNSNNNNTNNVVTLRNEDYTSTSPAGHSHSVKCDSGGEDDEYSAEFANYINENDYSNDTNRNNNNNSSYSESDQDYNYTPVKKRRRNHSEIDSGFATGSCSSNNSYAKRSLRSNSSVTRTSIATNYNNNNNDHSSDDDCHYEKFKKRVKKARVNIRKQIGGDSDSN